MVLGVGGLEIYSKIALGPAQDPYGGAPKLLLGHFAPDEFVLNGALRPAAALRRRSQNHQADPSSDMRMIGSLPGCGLSLDAIFVRG